MKGNPILLNTSFDESHLLDRIEIKNYSPWSEDWMQGVIFKNPKLLPVTEFDDSYAPLIPLGREIGTNSGFIDNLYVSPLGKLTIVETKLWKNPEKHRTVVAQIIDYAKELSLWNYDMLDSAICKVSHTSLEQLVAPHLETHGITISDFQERVISSLQTGSFLLLIVGDRISANLALLAGAIQGSPGLDFTLGLIELQIHKLSKENEYPLVIIPDIVGRTVEEVRGVIQISYVTEKPKVAVEMSDIAQEGNKREKTNRVVFLSKLPEALRPIYEQWIDEWEKNKRFVLYWGTEGFSLRVNLDDGKLHTVFDAYPKWALSLIRDIDLMDYTEPHREYRQNIDSISKAINILAQGKKYLGHEDITADALEVILAATNKFADQVAE